MRKHAPGSTFWSFASASKSSLPVVCKSPEISTAASSWLQNPTWIWIRSTSAGVAVNGFMSGNLLEWTRCKTMANESGLSVAAIKAGILRRETNGMCLTGANASTPFVKTFPTKASSPVGQNLLHWARIQLFKATSCSGGEKVGEPYCWRSSCTAIWLKIQLLWIGLASCPTAVSVSFTLVPQSVEGSMPHRAAASFGCRCLVCVLPSRAGALLVMTPKSPFSCNLDGASLCSRHPHAHGWSWLPHEWRAVGQVPAKLSKWGLILSPSAWNAWISSSFKLRASSSLGSQWQSFGITWQTLETSNVGKHSASGIGPTSEELTTTHHLLRRETQTSWRWSTTSRKWLPVLVTNSNNFRRTAMSSPAGVTHSKTKIGQPNKWASFSVPSRLLERTSREPFWSPRRLQGWQLKPADMVQRTGCLFQISRGAWESQMSMQRPERPWVVSHKPTMRGFASTPKAGQKPLARAPCPRAPIPQHTSMTLLRPVQVTFSWVITPESFPKQRHGQGLVATTTRSTKVKVSKPHGSFPLTENLSFPRLVRKRWFPWVTSYVTILPTKETLSLSLTSLRGSSQSIATTGGQTRPNFGQNRTTTGKYLGRVLNTLTSQILRKHLYLQVFFFIVVRFSVAGSLPSPFFGCRNPPKRPKIPSQYPLQIQRPKIVRKITKTPAEEGFRCENFKGPPPQLKLI